MNDSCSTLLLTRGQVSSLLTLDDCITAVEEAFREHGTGRTPTPQVLGMHATDGGFHIKAALLPGESAWFAAKLNGNFSHNQERFGMPTIQGVLVLMNASNGYPLAVMDSIEITVLRTGAATAVAARHLARRESTAAAICGCGKQGRVQLRALARILPIKTVFAYDLDPAAASRFADELAPELGVRIEAIRELQAAVRKSDVCVTCTTAKEFFIRKDDVMPGTFIAGVGADNEEKQEIDPQLLASSKVVADILMQCAAIGDLHHAIEAGLMRAGEIHAELGEVVSGRKPGRTSKQEITIFDSTGTALQDAAVAALVYERALKQRIGLRVNFQAN